MPSFDVGFPCVLKVLLRFRSELFASGPLSYFIKKGFGVDAQFSVCCEQPIIKDGMIVKPQSQNLETFGFYPPVKGRGHV